VGLAVAAGAALLLTRLGPGGSNTADGDTQMDNWRRSGGTVLKAWSRRGLRVAAAILVCAGGAEARITRVEILNSEPAFDGATFGSAGAYLRLLGRVSGEFSFDATGVAPRCPETYFGILTRRP
jgi:hypothetical protein